MLPRTFTKRWLSRIRIVAAILGMGAIGYFVGQSVGNHQSETPNLEGAIQALRWGYDRTALSLLRPLTAEGNARAEYWLSDMYENGLGVRADMRAALDLLKKSAEQGFAPAQARLGELYLRGDEAMQDFGAAMRWLSEAALGGNAVAQREVGQMYALGLGVSRDPAEAYGWYENAARAGDGLAERLRDDIASQMSPQQIAKGQQRAKVIRAVIP